MDPIDLSALLKCEDARVEWKESDRQDTEILRAVCALANDLEDSRRTGYLLLGVRKNGTVAGLAHQGQKRDEACQRISNMVRSTKLVPTPAFAVDVLEYEGTILLAVRVEPYPVPPVVKVDGVSWVRNGPTTHRAGDADLAHLQERRPEQNQPFDARPVRQATLEDLRLQVLGPLYDAARAGAAEPDAYPDLSRWLIQRDLARATDSGFHPNYACILLYGIAPETFVPGATIELARFAGVDLGAPINQRKTISGTLPEQLDAAWTQLTQLNVDVPAESSGMRTGYAPMYPIDVLRELTRNMVQHRLYSATHAPGRISWFDDRIVFNNPGGPFGQASQGELGKFSDYRNPTITRELAGLAYIERLGRGVALARAALARNGNPPLEVETDGFTTVVVRRHR